MGFGLCGRTTDHLWTGKKEKEEIETSKYPPLEGSLQKVPVENDPQNPTLSSGFGRTDRNPKCGP